MAKFTDCLKAAVTTGKLSQEEANLMAEEVQSYADALVESHGYAREAANRAAVVGTLTEKKAELKRQKFHKALQFIAIRDRRIDIKSHPLGMTTGLYSALAEDITKKATYKNISRKGHANYIEAQRRLFEPMYKLRRTWLGFGQDKKLMNDVAHELSGKKTGNEDAAVFAEMFSGVFEFQRKAWNRVGGNTAKREDWGYPQSWDAKAVGKVSPEDFADELIEMNAFDTSKMFNDKGLPISQTELREAIMVAHGRMRTNGLVDIMPGRQGGKKLANRRTDSRFFVFRDSDIRLKVNEKYGKPDLYSTFMEHIEGMANDIALLEQFGPNPELTWRTLRDEAKLDKYKGNDPGMRGSFNLAALDSLWNTVSGKTSDIASLGMAEFWSGIRNWIVSARLDRAVLSAVGDEAYLANHAQFTGTSTAKLFKTKLGLLASTDQRLFAARLGINNEVWASRAHGANRFSEVMGDGMSAQAAEFTMRATGLSKLTDANKTAVGMEWLGYMADYSDRAFKDVPDLYRAQLERFGIDDAKWEIIRSTDQLEFREVKYFSIEDLMKREDLTEKQRMDIAYDLEGMIYELALGAVPEPGARARSITTGGKARGTPSRELLFGNVMQFKGFSISVLTNVLYGGISNGSKITKTMWLSKMMVMMTLSGALALQLKEISKGRDPKKMDNAMFWIEAFMQGGGLGIYADFLYQGIFGSNRYGGSMIATAGGPFYGLVEDVSKVTLGQGGKAIEEKDINFAADMVRFAKQNMPYGLWYTDLILERTIGNDLDLLADPKVKRKWARERRRRKKELDQEYYWPPGETSPRRAPKF